MTSYRTRISIVGLGEVQYQNYNDELGQIEEAIQGYCQITHQSEMVEDHVPQINVFDVTFEAEDLWEAHEFLVNGVVDTVESLGYKTKIQKPEVMA